MRKLLRWRTTKAWTVRAHKNCNWDTDSSNSLVTLMRPLRKRNQKRKRSRHRKMTCGQDYWKLRTCARIWKGNSPDMWLPAGIEPPRSSFSKKTMDLQSIFGQSAASLLSYLGWWKKTHQLSWTVSLFSLESPASLCHQLPTSKSSERASHSPIVTSWQLSLASLELRLRKTKVSSRIKRRSSTLTLFPTKGEPTCRWSTQVLPRRLLTF